VSTRSAELMHELVTTKIQVMKIVADYLYSGRDQEAWETLSEMWPAQDMSRIRLVLLALENGEYCTR